MREATPQQAKFDAEMKQKTRQHRLETAQKNAEVAAEKVRKMCEKTEAMKDIEVIDTEDGFDSLTLAKLRQHMACWQHRARHVPSAFRNRVLSTCAGFVQKSPRTLPLAERGRKMPPAIAGDVMY